MAAGKIRDALELLAVLGARGANLVPKFLEAFHAKEKLTDGNCQKIALKTAELFRAVGQSPGIIKMMDGRGNAQFWWYKGERITINGQHFFVRVGEKVYDLISGVSGMAEADYIKLIELEVTIKPILEVVK